MRVLSVVHGPNVPGGVFDEVVLEEGHELERWEVPLGGAPKPARSYDAIMVFGGSMHPDQDADHPWLEREEVLLRQALADDVPVVGVCLGAQMLARSAGALVRPAPASEIGWLDVELTPAGRDDPVLGVLPARTDAFHWHSYTFDVPQEGRELARSALCTQAFRVGRHGWGVQFHAEVTLPMVEAWIAEEPDELPVEPQELRLQTERRIAEWNRHGRRLCAAFLEIAAQRSRKATARETRAAPR